MRLEEGGKRVGEWALLSQLSVGEGKGLTLESTMGSLESIPIAAESTCR